MLPLMPAKVNPAKDPRTLRDPRGLRLLVFDWDGTLMDSIGPIVACTRAALEDLGVAQVDESLIRGAVGLGLRETIELVFPGVEERQIGEIREAYRRHWLETFRDEPILYPGVPEMLANLTESGYLLAVATGKSRRGLDHALLHSGLGKYFLSTRTVDEAPSKPHPGMLLGLFDELGTKASETLMIGDTTWDLEMARNAGARSVAILSGTQEREALERAEPQACLATVVDITAWLENLA